MSERIRSVDTRSPT